MVGWGAGDMQCTSPLLGHPLCSPWTLGTGAARRPTSPKSAHRPDPQHVPLQLAPGEQQLVACQPPPHGPARTKRQPLLHLLRHRPVRPPLQQAPLSRQNLPQPTRRSPLLAQTVPLQEELVDARKMGRGRAAPLLLYTMRSWRSCAPSSTICAWSCALCGVKMSCSGEHKCRPCLFTLDLLHRQDIVPQQPRILPHRLPLVTNP